MNPVKGCILMKILVATDGSEQSMKAVQRAVELAETEGAEITLISVAFYSKEDMAKVPPDIRAKLESPAAEALRAAKALFDERGIMVETILDADFVPANVIIRKAEEGGFDRILLGSTGAGDFKKIFIGSTAAKVVANSPCSVTVIR